MNQEKEMTQTVSSAGEYLAPRVKVVVVRARRVMCQSQLGSMNVNNNVQTDGDDGDFE